jgi:hypothetical protein
MKDVGIERWQFAASLIVGVDGFEVFEIQSV